MIFKLIKVYRLCPLQNASFINGLHRQKQRVNLENCLFPKKFIRCPISHQQWEAASYCGCKPKAHTRAPHLADSSSGRQISPNCHNSSVPSQEQAFHSHSSDKTEGIAVL